MKTLLIPFLSALLAVGVLGQIARGAASPGVGEGPVYIDSTEILHLESFPVQVQLVVRGSLPTPCHETRWELEEPDGTIVVRLWSEADPDRICIQVLEPFEVSIPLGSYESADLAVQLNGEEVGRVEIASEPSRLGGSLLGAGWSFGMCAGYCVADLSIVGERLVLTGRSQADQPPLYVNEGLLTGLARERIGSTLEALAGSSLEPVYGWPDRPNGGAAYLAIEMEGQTSRHEMEFGDPPEELAELHRIAMALIRALEACASDELVSIGDACEPWER